MTGNSKIISKLDKKNKSKLPFWSLRFGRFCHFSPNFKPFAILVPVVLFFCHFGPIFKFGQIPQFKPTCFVLLLKGIFVILGFILTDYQLNLIKPLSLFLSLSLSTLRTLSLSL
ncbi:hypothetical protein Hanom_Chr15g01413841 [Helianthus anomalus]